MKKERWERHKSTIEVESVRVFLEMDAGVVVRRAVTLRAIWMRATLAVQARAGARREVVVVDQGDGRGPGVDVRLDVIDVHDGVTVIDVHGGVIVGGLAVLGIVVSRDNGLGRRPGDGGCGGDGRRDDGGGRRSWKIACSRYVACSVDSVARCVRRI
jgi:hypothetical protein